MNQKARTAVSLAGGILASSALLPWSAAAQTPLPATAPTAISPSQLPSANPPVPQGATTIEWDGHLLRISASGESLAQVLDQVASRTGIRMVGSPPSDRIYGSYGPAPLVDVLSDLVSGLPVNMLFVDRVGTTPARLTFTARNGAATPASPATSFAQQNPTQAPDANPSPVSNSFSRQPASNVPANPGFAPPANPGFAPPATGNGTATADAPAQPADGNATPASPNGVKTPQEIFEQLQRLRSNTSTAH
ncbi:RodZ family helix-turn-helix domain-containing protein [Terriglobus aquaticus]|uniref:Secretin/TonB short N-terminal domain-containing protein n=1 Tax=Terriglobus aquaticus TaxID=940139 RepID=A0ABW9KK31_9BACT|nr:hypothetical protein [Terriglobus aquaticus]